MALKKIEVVYFAYLCKEWDIFLEQMDYIFKEDLYNKADKLNLCCTIDESRLRDLKKLIEDKYSKWCISNISFTNSFEYPGISYLHSIAQEDTYYLYLHTKGICYYNSMNLKLRKKLHDNLIKNYDECIKFLDEGYDKVACFKSPGGFCWFNFFWITGGFLKTLPTPLNDINNRWYYESYINGDVNKTKSLVIPEPILAEPLLNFLASEF